LNQAADSRCSVYEQVREQEYQSVPCRKDSKISARHGKKGAPSERMMRIYLGHINRNVERSELLLHISRHLDLDLGELRNLYFPSALQGNRGFAFVDVPRRALKKLERLASTQVRGRRLAVEEAKPGMRLSLDQEGIETEIQDHPEDFDDAAQQDEVVSCARHDIDNTNVLDVHFHAHQAK